MNDSIHERIRTGDGRQKRTWAEALYGHLKGILTGEGYRNTTFEESFVSQSPEDQIKYLSMTIASIATVTGYADHAQNLTSLVEDYHPLHHTNIQPEIQARKFSGTIREWREFIDKDGIYQDWKVQSESGETALSWEDFARRNYRTIDTAFLESDADSECIINGFELPQKMLKLPVGTPVEIIALGFVRLDGSFASNDLYGVRLTKDSAEKVGLRDTVYFDLMRDNPRVFPFMVESQRELGKARQLLYEQ